MKKAAVFFADGFEEIEAITQVDLLKRANIYTVMVSITENKLVEGAHGIKINTDMTIDKNILNDLDAVIFPGGMPGTENLYKCDDVKEIINYFNINKKLIAAICAAPMIFGQMGILKGKKACAYPGFEKYLKEAIVEYKNVCIDQNIITSRGVGTAIDFAAAIIEYINDKNSANEVIKSIVYK